MKLELKLGEVEWIYLIIDGVQQEISTCLGDDFISDLSSALKQLKAGNATTIKGWQEGSNLVLELAYKDVLRVRAYIEDDDTFEVLEEIGVWIMKFEDFEEQCQSIFDFCKLNKKEYEKVTGLKLPKNL